MAPDKIYVKEFDEGISQMWSRVKATETTANVQHEYIRKDALMEWAKSQKAKLKQGYKHDWKNDDMLHGGTLILDSLINKIESL